MFPFAAPILESKSMCAIFQKKGKVFENLHKNVQNLKIFWKRQVIVCDSYTQLAARIGSVFSIFTDQEYSVLWIKSFILKSPWNFFQQKRKKHYDLWKSSKKWVSLMLNFSFDQRYGLRWFMGIDRNNLDSVE